jgi:quercetin dioxygenase-like cupin family protein
MVISTAWQRLPETLVHGSIRRSRFDTDVMTVLRYEFAPHAVFPRHAHAEPQITLVLEGTLTFGFGDAASSHGAGEIVSIPGHQPHEGRAGDAGAVILCLFAPPRG